MNFQLAKCHSLQKLSLIFCLMVVSIFTFAQNSAIEKSIALDSERVISIQLDDLKDSPFYFLTARTLQKLETVPILYFKTSEGNDEWSSWKRLDQFHEGALIDRHVFVGGDIPSSTKQISFRVENSGKAAAMVFRIFAPGHSDHPEAQNPDKSSYRSACNCEQKNLCDRDCWSNGVCPADLTPSPTETTHLIVHHSAGQTVNSDYAAVVRSYWDFHVNSNGWDDIGYNWLIDPNGILYQARGTNVQGAHFSCMNRNTSGICVIGNYEEFEPGELALQALSDFIAWEACERHIDVLANDYHPNSEMNLNNISGHRDGNISPNACSTTVCPGDNLFAKMLELKFTTAERPCLQEDATSVQSFAESKKINIFPNPNNGSFHIGAQINSIRSLEIFNTKGQSITSFDLFSTDLIDLPKNLSKGIYLAKIIFNDDTQSIEKIIVE